MLNRTRQKALLSFRAVGLSEERLLQVIGLAEAATGSEHQPAITPKRKHFWKTVWFNIDFNSTHFLDGRIFYTVPLKKKCCWLKTRCFCQKEVLWLNLHLIYYTVKTFYCFTIKRFFFKQQMGQNFRTFRVGKSNTSLIYTSSFPNFFEAAIVLCVSQHRWHIF